MANGLATLKIRADFLRVAAGRRKAVDAGLVLAGGAAARRDAEAAECGSASPPAAKSATPWCATGPSGGCGRLPPRCWPRCREAGTDYVLIARAATAERPFAALLGDLEAALRQVDQGTAPDASADGKKE